MDRADIAIIGAGIIGLAVAANVAAPRRHVYVLEKNPRFGMGNSGRSSEVIHGGIYYLPGSLKALTCVRGNAAIYELCDKYGINHARLGKLIVAVDDEEVRELEEMMGRGKENGMEGLRLLSGGEVKTLEPNVDAVAALLSPSTGIMDSHALMRYFAGRGQERGASFVYRAEVIGIEKEGDGYQLAIADNAGTSSLKSSLVINCAGLDSDRLAQMAGVDIASAGYKIHYCKGEYFQVAGSKSRLVSRLVYPLPEKKTSGLGIHVTITLEGKMRLGPNARYVDNIDLTVDEANRVPFADSVRRFLPAIEAEDLEPDMAGIRPTLRGPGEGFRDFIIAEESRRGLPGLINLVGIESPGLTSAPAIGELVADMVKELL